MKPGSRPRGFTLIEVLVALVIVAFGMGAVLTALTSAAENTLRLRDRTFAEWVGFNQLATTRLQQVAPTTGKSESKQAVDFGGSRWYWQQTVENTDVPGVTRITIQVRRYAQEPAAQGASDKAAADSASWLGTVVGFRGTAISSPQSVLPW